VPQGNGCLYRLFLQLSNPTLQRFCSWCIWRPRVCTLESLIFLFLTLRVLCWRTSLRAQGNFFARTMFAFKDLEAAWFPRIWMARNPIATMLTTVRWIWFSEPFAMWSRGLGY
jgi:hypothetical protein